MLGIYKSLAKAGITAGVPLSAALSGAALNRIGWLLANQDEVNAEAVTLNIDQKALNDTYILLATVYVSAEVWTIRRLMASPASAKIIQETAEAVAAGTATREGVEAAALKAGTSAGIGKALGKLLIVDTVIWAVTGLIDLGLNATSLTEEEQIELFSFMGPFNIVEPTGGLSLLGEFIISPILDEAFEYIPDEWVESTIDFGWTAAEYLGLDEWIGKQLGRYIESVDVDVSWWLIARVSSSAGLEGVAIYNVLNPERIFLTLTQIIIAKILLVRVGLPFLRALRA